MKVLTYLFVKSLLFYSAYSAMDGISNIIPDLTLLLDSHDNVTAIQKSIYSEDGRLNFTELAIKYIGTCEEYDVITEDGYILKLFHIPGNASSPVLFCPGYLVAPDNYLIRGNTSLLYMLAKQGFDVWAMSYRGVRYSRRHVELNPDADDKYWEFSMHEIGIYDYKAMIDFILERTGLPRLSIVGHSEGTTAFLILTSERPEYNNKVKVFAALAPICYLHFIGPIQKIIFTAAPVVFPLFKLFGYVEIAGYYSFEKKIIDIVCSQGIVGYELCFNIAGSVTGFNPKNIELGFTTTVLGHFPAGSSLKNMMHFTNIFQYNDFVKYDYGLGNLAVYGSVKPPVYNLTKVTTKVAMFVAKSDILSTMKDVKRLRSVLPNVVGYHVIKYFKFNHIDYMWGLNAHKVLYPYVIDTLLRYN